MEDLRDQTTKRSGSDEALRSRMLAWRHCEFSAHHAVRVPAEDAEGRKQLAGTMLRAPMSLEKFASLRGRSAGMPQVQRADERHCA